ncbi:MAG: cupredoxin domain-containing protein [Nitrososphaeraceae archaeon]
MYKKNVLSILVLMLALSAVVSLAFTQSALYIDLAYAQNAKLTQVEIAKGSADPSNGQFFVPQEASVSKGGQMTWTNKDTTIHTVVQGNPSQASSSSKPQFDSSYIQPGGTFDLTVNETGSVDYYCTLHPWMTAKINVS